MILIFLFFVSVVYWLIRGAVYGVLRFGGEPHATAAVEAKTYAKQQYKYVIRLVLKIILVIAFLLLFSH